MTDRKTLELIQSWKLSYNSETDNIYINGIEADTYDKRVICERLKERCKLDIDEQELKKLICEIQDNDLVEIVNDSIDIDNQENILSDINEIIEKDETIPDSEWEQYKIWKENKAIWNVDKEGEKTSLNKCIANIIGFIENFPKTKGKIKFNTVRNQVEWDGKQLTDDDIHKVLRLVNKYFIKDFSLIRMIKDALDNVAFQNKFNPWIEYFNRLQYVDDGTDYIDYTIKEVLHCEEQEKYYDLYYETLKIMMLAAMERIYKKEKNLPVKYDTVTSICSKVGGSGKGTFFERLFDIDNNGNTYCYVLDSDSFKPSDKEFLEKSHQCVCLLLDELSMKRAIITSVKGYITKRTDKFRKSYGYVNEDHIRGFIIAATSNNDDILKDYTTDNERRWAIIKMCEDSENYKNVNKAFDNGFRDKIWAFIKNIYETEEFKLYMTDERLIKLEGEIQRGYKASNNADYNTIINDLLERQYGFYTIGDKLIIDTDYICQQYLHGDSEDWCIRHNEEMQKKFKMMKEDKYVLKPSDKIISRYGMINRIAKKQLYDILDKLKFEYTKVSLNAEMRYSDKWNGIDTGHNTCRINGQVVNAYWRKEEYTINQFSYNTKNDMFG